MRPITLNIDILKSDLFNTISSVKLQQQRHETGKGSSQGESLIYGAKEITWSRINMNRDSVDEW
ncbi:hypothetical protein GcM1_233074 [Golovinomyces cichoracearum]|uniref:Uncharacterized protein n=1 Tax=Golovinomyces cichoracearum TaxID=62708 RepID=A0A420IM10_9PEZI|nr:hypothetical protein GcM1_233074 [Golovinomyces cichoracearum]